MVYLARFWKKDRGTSKISQRPAESYKNFVSHLLQVVSHLTVDGEGGRDLMI